MIQKQRTKKGSIRKSQEKLERQEVASPIKDSMPLLGRVGSFHCEVCDDISVHRITNQFTECIECRTQVQLKENSLKGERQLQEIMIM